MAVALVDTGVFLALLHRRDRWHEAAKREVAPGARLLTTWAVVTETVHMIGRADATLAFFEMLSEGAADIPHFGVSEFESFAWYFRKYADRKPDFADLSLLVLADMSGITRVLTFDRDFHVYRTRKRKPLDCPLLK